MKFHISKLKEFEQIQNCVRLSNGEVEIVAALDFGPRIVGYNFAGGENILGRHPEMRIESALGEFRMRGGHRLWIAPENMPETYAPDNEPIDYEFDECENSLRLTQAICQTTQTHKEINIRLDGEGSGAAITHKITNRSPRPIELAAWALTIMRPGGICQLPNEPFVPYGAETLLPVRNMTLWSYTDLSDPRWRIERDSTRLHVDAQIKTPQKIGVLNRQGWAKYFWENLEFTKRVEFTENAVYPDMNSNMELYTAGDFVEIETLAPLITLAPGAAVEHTEHWSLAISK